MNKQASLTTVDMDVLIYLSEYKFLTVAQFMRLRCLSVHTLTSEQERMLRLIKNQYVLRLALPHTGKGQPPFVYTLATKGQKELESLGLTGFSRARKSEVTSMRLPSLQHMLAVGDFLIAARLLPRAVPAYELAEFRHDVDLQKTPVRVPVRYGGREEMVSVVPDGWMDFRMSVPDRPKPRRRCIALELDRGTITNMSVFKQKIRALYFYAISEEYKALFGTGLCMVAFATTAGTSRVRQIKTWIQETLTLLDLEQEGNLFRVASIPAGELNPQEVFLSDLFYKPFEEEPVSLLWQSSQ